MRMDEVNKSALAYRLKDSTQSFMALMFPALRVQSPVLGEPYLASGRLAPLLLAGTERGAAPKPSATRI